MKPVIAHADEGVAPDAEAQRLTRWSLYLAPVSVAWVFVLGIVGWSLWVKILDHGDEGVALTDHGVVGWVVMILLALLGVFPAVLGGWFAVRALRLGARRGAWVGLVLDGGLVVLLVANAVSAVFTQV